MAFRTMTARYPGPCRRCKDAGLTGPEGQINPGDRIRFGGRGRAYHMAADCPTSEWGAADFQASRRRSCGCPADYHLADCSSVNAFAAALERESVLEELHESYGY